MAENNHVSPKISQLIAESELSRAQITHSYGKAKKVIDTSKRWKSSLERIPSLPLVTSVIAGLGVSFLFPKRREKEPKNYSEKKSSSLAWKAGIALFTLLRPTIKTYTMKLLKDILERRAQKFQ